TLLAREIAHGRVHPGRAPEAIAMATEHAGAPALPPGGFEMAWQPELQDWAEVFTARARARGTVWRLAAIDLVLAGIAVLGAVGGWWDLFVGSLIAGAFLLYIQGPGRRQSVRRFLRQAPILHLPQRVRVLPGEGVVAGVSGNTTHWAWRDFT